MEKKWFNFIHKLTALLLLLYIFLNLKEKL